MLERIVITVTVIGCLALLWLVWQYYKSRLVQAIQPVELSTGKPTLLYFTGEYCTACKVQQTPIVEKISSKLGDAVVVKTYDVAIHPDIASRFKVLTLPTTVVLDERGQVKAINYGVTQQHKLEAQLI
jgi:thiol-disulfide isomerase/thioredoxin